MAIQTINHLCGEVINRCQMITFAQAVTSIVNEHTLLGIGLPAFFGAMVIPSKANIYLRITRWACVGVFSVLIATTLIAHAVIGLFWPYLPQAVRSSDTVIANAPTNTIKGSKAQGGSSEVKDFATTKITAAEIKQIVRDEMDGRYIKTENALWLLVIPLLIVLFPRILPSKAQ